jgi:hypothetical protein
LSLEKTIIINNNKCKFCLCLNWPLSIYHHQQSATSSLWYSFCDTITYCIWDVFQGLHIGVWLCVQSSVRTLESLVYKNAKFHRQLFLICFHKCNIYCFST